MPSPIASHASCAAFLPAPHLPATTNPVVPTTGSCPRLSPVMKSRKRHRSSSSHSSSSSSSPTPPSASTPPQRINVESSTLSLRQQLSLARQAAAAAADSSASTKRLERTSFRRRKQTVDPASDIGVAARRRHRALANSLADPPTGKYDYTHPPVIFIDGYNIIGAWPKLRKHRDRGDLFWSRRILIDDVVEFAALRGWRCIIVFDAQAAERPQRTEETDAGAVVDVIIVYTSDETADTYIEREVFRACKQGDRQIWAATSDLVQAKVSGALGAHVMSASLFVQELKRARKDVKETVEELSRDGEANRAKMLMSTVDKDTLKQLYNLRDQLDGRKR